MFNRCSILRDPTPYDNLIFPPKFISLFFVYCSLPKVKIISLKTNNEIDDSAKCTCTDADFPLHFFFKRKLRIGHVVKNLSYNKNFTL